MSRNSESRRYELCSIHLPIQEFIDVQDVEQDAGARAGIVGRRIPELRSERRGSYLRSELLDVSRTHGKRG